MTDVGGHGPATTRLVERVWQQRAELVRLNIRPEEFTVHVSLDIWEAVLVESRSDDTPRPIDLTDYEATGCARVFGLPLVPDEKLAPDSVILRYEVTA